MSKKLLISCFLILVTVFSFVVGLSVTNKNKTDYNVYAEIEYEYSIYNLDDGLWYMFYACASCSHEYFMTADDPDTYEDMYTEFEDWEILTDYCRNCYHGHLCEECFDDLSDKLSCSDCNLCYECWDNDIHCHQCGSCSEDLCQDCLEAEGWHNCLGCHSEQSHCPGCGVCLYPMDHYGAVCRDYGDPHCIYCDEEWICNECGECFFNFQDKFCEECQMCIDCAMSAGLHCPYCSDCLIENGSACEFQEGVCLSCCIDIGNHCDMCIEHIEDGNWCRGGQDCGHCFICADDEGWICPSCERCEQCDGFEWCDSCGLCEECCDINAELLGCVCGEYCIEDGSFEDADHLCSLCGENFSCVMEFCEQCGLCMECCIQNSEDAGCECGLCIESSEFEDHLCENCGLPFCVRGEPCEECGLCEECCLEESMSQGCTCGLCVMSDEFTNPEHLCDECGENLSCNMDFCDACGLCEECCEKHSQDEGCDHGICIESTDWEDHFCDICDKCKEDCNCGEDCCADPGGYASGTHGTNVPVGTITKQPTNKTRTVTKNTRKDRAENLASFHVYTYDPQHNVTYQWYVVEGDKAPVALVDDTEYIVSQDETLIIVSGAKTNKLTVATPSNACTVDYYYYCVVTTTTNETFESVHAHLIGRHNYGYVWTSENGHSHGCVGCGIIEEHSETPHKIGPWRYARYATSTIGALIVRECNLCGGIAESKTTEPLGDHPYHTYIYQPVYDIDKNNNIISTYHEKVCLCGRKGSIKEEHVWSAWVITKLADEKHTGSKYHDCAVCNYRETVEIKKQTHDHVFCFDYDESPTGMTSTTGYNATYHWAYCVYSDCHAQAYKEEHHFDEWQIRSIPYNFETDTNRLVWRTCQICGYNETKEIKSGYKALAVINGTMRAQSVDNWEGTSSVHTVTAKAPKGYYFDHWEVVCPEGYTVDDLFNFDVGYWKKWKLSDGTQKSEYVRTTMYDETLAFKLRHLYDESYSIVYQLKAVCYRYENQLLVYPNADKDDCYYLGEGDTIATNYNPNATGISKQNSVIWVESIEEYEFGWVIYHDEDDYGERTMTVHLNGYRGGSIEVTSYEQELDKGLPCNLHIIVDKDSVITTDSIAAIWGCAYGGDVIISSNNGSTLTIRVNALNPYTGEVYGIHTDKSPNGFSSKVSFQGNVKVNIYVTNQGSGYSQNSVSIGIYTTTQVEVLDKASIHVEALSWDHGEDSRGSTAYAIQAGKELRINTTGYVELKVTGVRDDVNKKGQGVKSKAIYVDEVDHLYIDYNKNVKSGSNCKPQYDAKNLIEYIMDMGDYTRKVIEHGYRVTFVMQQEEETSPIIDVERWYTNEDGQYLVRLDENIEFRVNPPLGYYDSKLFINGSALDGYRESDGVTMRYIIYSIDQDITINVYAGTEFHPFTSQPDVSQKNVYYNTEAQLSYHLSGTEALYYHSMFGGEKSTDPKFKKEMGKYDTNIDPELITTNFTINRVFLQRYDTITNTYKNTGIDFAVSAESSVKFSDGANHIGETVKYRLVIVFDGVEYTSQTFTVTWTENQEDIPETLVDMVELHVKHSRYNDIEGGKFDGGDARIRLDSENPYLIYSVALNQTFVGDSLDYLHSQRFGEKPITIAEFNYHNGTLILYGTTYAIDFNNDGDITSDERINIDDEILAIYVPDDASVGGLIINVLNNTTIGGSVDNYGWNGDKHYFRPESVINNEYGFIRVKSTNSQGSEPELNIIHKTKARDIEGILAMEEVYVEGNILLNITLSSADYMTESANGDRYGIFSRKDIIIRGNAIYTYTGLVTNTSKTLLGESCAVHTENGSFKMLNNAYAIIYADAKFKNEADSYSAIYAVNVSIVENASMYIETDGDVYLSIVTEEDILFATTGIVSIHSKSNTIDAYGVDCYYGTFEVRYPTTLIYESLYNRPVIEDSEKFALVGRYTQYNKIGYYKYFPGDNYRVSIIIDDDMEYYFTQCDYTVTEPDTTELLTGFKYNEFELSIRTGDTITIVAKEARHGFVFDGWEFISIYTLENLKYDLDGRSISFTMPSCPVNLYPKYTCTAFDENPTYVIVRETESKHGTLYWHIDASKNLTRAYLEQLNDKGEWVAFDWKFTTIGETTHVGGMTTFSGEEKIKVIGAEGEGEEIAEIGTYRIVAWSNDGLYADYPIYSEPFVIDFEGCLHLLASEDAFSPTVAIPSGYVGTEYKLYISDYIYSDYDLTYEFRFGKLYEAVESGDIEFTLDGKVATFKRNATQDKVYSAIANTNIVVTDSKSKKLFYIPFDFGEVKETTTYPVYVNGIQINEHNKNDVLGDGTVSYDHTTLTLTLNNADLSNIYSKTIQYGGTTIGGYVILADGQDLIINLVGENTITVDSDSYCTNISSDEKFNGEIIAIGNSTIANNNYPKITFIGTGSLVINVAGENSKGIYSNNVLTINDCSIEIYAEENGITIERGSLVINSGELTIDAQKKSAVELKYLHGNFYMEDGKLAISGGSDDYAIKLADGDGYISIYKKYVTIQTKSTTYGLTNNRIDYDNNYLLAYISTDGENFVVGNADETTKYIKLVRNLYVWVNGERITPEHLTVDCGEGKATYNLQTNTLTLENATITKGISYYYGVYYASAIYSEEPITINFVGDNTIDLTDHDFYDALTGEKYTPGDEEDEQYRRVYGIHTSKGMVTYSSHDYDNVNLILMGARCTITGVSYGIESTNSVTLLGAKITVSNCEIGITANSGLVLETGNLKITADKGEDSYAIYGEITIGEHYIPVTIFGTNSGDLVRLDYNELTKNYQTRWGEYYKYLWIRDVETNTEIYHEWGEVVYTWSEDGTKLTATRVCTNDSNHIETETVDVISEIVEQPNCTTNGKTKYTSDVFENHNFKPQTRILDDIEFLGHNPIIVRENEVASTCTVAGHYDEVIYCSVCGEEISRELKHIDIDENAHDWGEWTVTKTPSEYEYGEETRICKHNHEHTETRKINALGVSVKEIEVTKESASDGIDVKAIFDTAKAENQEVMITVSGIEISFDTEAVNTISDSTAVTFSIIEEDGEELEIEGTQKVLNITITGFTAGKSKVIVPFETEIPENRIGKVYYVDDEGNKTDMNATFVNGTVVFETTHFSKYVIVFEEKATTPEEPTEPDTPQEPENPNQSGKKVVVVIVIVVIVIVLSLGIFSIVWFVLKQKSFADLISIFKK